MADVSDLELMRLHVDALSTHTAGTRIHSVNEPDGAAAPRFYLGRTTEGPVWRFRFDLPDALVVQLEQVCRNEPHGRDLREPPVHLARYIALLETHAPVESTSAGPAYSFAEVLPRPRRSAFSVTPENSNVLRLGFPDWLGDVPHRRPLVAILVEGAAVSLCASVRITPRAHEAGVDTWKDFRRRGYASDAVTHWASAVRQLGAIPLDSTSWSNTASIGVARRLDLHMYGSD